MKKFLCFALNNFGTGGCPVARDDSLGFFYCEYIRECVDRAVNSGELSPAALELANGYLTEA